jgi:hypothetical protein
MQVQVGAQVVVRHVRDGRNLAVWKVQPAPPEDGGWQLQEVRPQARSEGAIPGRRVVYRCHPKRCGAVFPFKLETISKRVVDCLEAGRDELWLG